jgi:hypothetical protein
MTVLNVVFFVNQENMYFENYIEKLKKGREDKE